MSGINARAKVLLGMQHRSVGDWPESKCRELTARGFDELAAEHDRRGEHVLAQDCRNIAAKERNKIKVTPVPAGVRPPVTLASTGVGLPGRHHPALVGDPAFREGPVSPNLKEVGQ